MTLRVVSERTEWFTIGKYTVLRFVPPFRLSALFSLFHRLLKSGSGHQVKLRLSIGYVHLTKRYRMTTLIVFCARFLFVSSFLCFGAVMYKSDNPQRKALMLRAILVALLSIALAKGLGAVYYEPRPFVVQHIQPLVPHEPDSGFPSDHTLLVFACAFLLVPFSRPAALITLLIGSAVGTARVLSHLHSPLDIGASIVFALLANVVAAFLIRLPAQPDR